LATYAPEIIDRDGLAATYHAAAGGGDKFNPGRDVFVHIKNGGGGSITATFTTSAVVEELSVADAAVTVPAGAERLAGPFPAHLFEDDVDGLVHVGWSGTTTVTFAVLSTR
jgi:hypothetical protein